MINATETTFSILVPLQYAACVYLVVVIAAGTSLNITSVVRLVEAIKVSFFSLQEYLNQCLLNSHTAIFYHIK